MPLFDAHMHSSHDPGFIPSPKGTYLTCASKPGDWKLLEKEKRKEFRIFAGLHPIEIPPDRNLLNLLLEQLSHLIRKHKSWGLGECGLDRRFYNKITRELQMVVLIKQFRMATKHKRPLSLHQVRAPGALAELLEKEKPDVPLIIHGFKEKYETAMRYIRQGAYLSLGPGSHWGNKDFLSMVKQLPREHLLLESDWPYARGDYTPLMENLYNQAALTLGIDRDALEELINRNGKVFKD